MALVYTFAWQRALAAIAGGSQEGAINGYQFVQRYFWQPTLSDVVEVHKYYAQQIVAWAAGVLFTDCLT
jgi:hypothetical protein